MPHISQYRINDADFKKIYTQLITLFDTAGGKRRSEELLKELITETEKIMIAKRLAIIFLIEEGISPYSISSILKVSTSTVSKTLLKYETHRYPYISNIIKKNKSTIWDSLEIIIRAGMPPRVGKGRWKWSTEVERRLNKKTFIS